MRLAVRYGCDSEGFHAHNILSKSKRRRWKYRASSKIIDNLASSPATWKEAKTVQLGRGIVSKPEQLSFDFTLERAFRPLVQEWIDATEHTSNMLKAVKHPAYQQIIGMGKVAPSHILPLLL